MLRVTRLILTVIAAVLAFVIAVGIQRLREAIMSRKPRVRAEQAPVVDEVEEKAGAQVHDAGTDEPEQPSPDAAAHLADTSADHAVSLTPSLMLHMLAEHNRYGALALSEEDAHAAHKRLHQSDELEHPHAVEDLLFRPAVAARIALQGSRDMAAGIAPEVP